MSMATGKFVPNDARTTLITVASYADRVPVGTVFNSFVGEVAFTGYAELLVYIDTMLDSLELPKATMSPRSFHVKVETAKAETAERPTEAVASFKIKVIFRQNASWQGSLAWVEGESEASFRSVLELIRLMDEAMTGAIPDKNDNE